MSIYVAPRPMKAMLGPGAAAMTTQPFLKTYAGPLAQQKLMYEAATFWKTDPWIRSAERVISGRFSTAAWHLEDEQDTEIDDQYPDARYQQVRSLIERPQAMISVGRQLTRRELWATTSRHMGACGNAFWFLDQLEPTGKTPAGVIYIAPWRMSAASDAAGNLTGWVLDYNEQSHTGTPLDLAEVLHFTLEPPDEGHFGVGLVESALSFASLDKLAIGHAGQVLTSGGRLAGIVSPKSDSIPDEQFQQLVRDFRTISEMPDNAKRVNIMQSPITFDRTAATPLELSLLDLMKEIRDDILALWGVPLSQIGGTSPAGMNSGDIRKYDEAALWQNAIHPRLVSFTETVQFQLLDRWKTFGMSVELEVDEPEFDDDGPRFELLAKSAGLPMRNEERRALIGLDPFGDPLLDQAIWLPINLVQIGTAPDPDGSTPTSPDTVPPDSALGGETIVAKAKLTTPLQRALAGIRSRVEKTQTPALKDALKAFLDAQRREIASRLRANASHIAAKPKETSVWFPDARFNRELNAVLARPLTAMAQNVSDHIGAVLPAAPGKAAPDAVERALHRGAARVTGINARTKEQVAQAIAAGIDEGLSVLEIADIIEGIGSDSLSSLFDEYRAELIARTELMDAYNGAALASYSDGGIELVEAIDGDEDPECADRVAGNPYSIDAADAIEDHPNGTLDWVPVMADGKAALELRYMKAQIEALERPPVQPIFNNYITPPDIRTGDTYVTTPDVHVGAPNVTVEPTSVVVNMPEPKSTRKTIERDIQGQITRIVEEPDGA